MSDESEYPRFNDPAIPDIKVNFDMHVCAFRKNAWGILGCFYSHKAKDCLQPELVI
jgi:hypothetical protein